MSFTSTTGAFGREVVSLYEGQPSGSESWNHEEQESTDNVFQTRLIYNVTKPTLTIFRPEKPNGTGVVICPGGGFHCLSMDTEGNQVAEWLNKKGVTCFVLKYRLLQCKTKDPALELMMKGMDKVEQEIAPIAKLAMDDGLQAMRYVRSHADEVNVDNEKIVLLGFSAGGTLVTSVAFHCDETTRPNYLAPIYAQVDWALTKDQVPENAPPIFLVAASNDQLGLAEHSVRLYRQWLKATKPAELHLYAEGGHGFGMRTQNLPSDHWIERFGDWLANQGLLVPADSNQ